MDTMGDGIERSTFAAVPPQRVLELPGWLVGLDDRTVRRVHSAVRLWHDSPPVLPLPALEAEYKARHLRPVFRVPSLCRSLDMPANCSPQAMRSTSR